MARVATTGHKHQPKQSIVAQIMWQRAQNNISYLRFDKRRFCGLRNRFIERARCIFIDTVVALFSIYL